MANFVGFFYAGFGAIVTPFGIAAAYGEDMTQYNNALGFWVLCKSVESEKIAH